jgi:hypothetical protein
MKRCAVLGLIICLIGCTTLQPVTGNRAAVQQRIASGALLKRGDAVVVLTKDGRTHDFNVTSTSASTIEGRYESISIDQIDFIQTRKLSVEKTALAVGLAVVVAAAVVVVCSVGGCRSSAPRASGRSGRSGRFAQPLPQPLLLPTPPPNSLRQRCDSEGDDGESPHVQRCAT